jgi:hypothetical protein
MKPENTNYPRRTFTDADRDNVLKLLGCGLSTLEIADIAHISKSSVGNIRQAHTACINKEWETVKRLARSIGPTVEWALKVTGTENEYFDYLFPEPAPSNEPVKNEDKYDNTTNPILRDDLLGVYATLQDIRSLLVEIRDMLK